MTTNEILTKGYKSLKDALGLVGMIRFIQHLMKEKMTILKSAISG